MKNFLYVSVVFLCLFFASCDLSNKADKDFIDKLKKNKDCISKKFDSEEKSFYYLTCLNKKRSLDNSKLVLKIKEKSEAAYKELEEKLKNIEINKD